MAPSAVISVSQGDPRPKILFMPGCPSGQREQTVNLPAIAYGGSNPSPGTKLIVGKADDER